LSCHYALLTDEALLHITGPESLAFLQGQTTCDTRRLDDSHALPGAYCTPQGRVVCDFLLCQLAPGHCALRMRRDIRSGAAAVFGKYILFSRAELDAGDAGWQIAACWGEGVAARLQSIFGGVPGERYGVHAGEGFVLVQMDADGQQFECYLDDAQNPDWRKQLQAALESGDLSTWQALQIDSGIARIEAATVEAFVPQILNYDLTGHISFRKGCYTGQEVIARLHYRGQAKRRMYLARMETRAGNAAPQAGMPQAGMPQAGMPQAGMPQAGMPLFNAGDERAVGTVVNSAVTAAGGVVALVTATAPGLAAGLRLGSPDGPGLEPGELPYSLPT
jgi:folate-binding protein YgfZ